ncbi:MAG: carbonic anhydrase [Clostridia bacterium]|nr:carbonic anhydrase [Clostridia bacterium]
MEKLIKVSSEKDIPLQYRNTPVEQLLKYHNLNHTFGSHQNAELLVGMCMDNRKQLSIPNNYAYIIRTGGGNLRYNEFKISYAIAMGGVRSIVLIAHNECGMVNLMSKKEKFVEGMINNAGWNAEQAEEHFMSFAPVFEINDEIGFVLSESKRLREKYRNILIVPLFYMLEDNLLYIVVED